MEKTSGTGFNSVVSELWKDPNPGSPYKAMTNYYATAYSKLVTRGENTANFHQRRARGELLPFTDFYQFEGLGTASGDYTATRTNDGYKEWRSPAHNFVHRTEWEPSTTECLNIITSSDARQFVQAAAARVYTRGWDALTFIAELNKTKQMFSNVLKRFLEALSSGQFYKIWLEGRYGWRPLFYDVKDVVEALELLNGERQRFKEKVGTTEMWSSVATSTWTTTIVSASYSTKTDFTLGLRGSVVADIEPSFARFNPVVTLWEKIPYSFVIDWFISVGNFLESMSFIALQSQYCAAAGYNIRVEKTLTTASTSWTSGWTGSYSQSGNSTAIMTLRVPTQLPYYPLPAIKLDEFKLLDAISLLKQKWRFL